MDWAQLVLGLALYLAPGVAWAWALGDRLRVPERLVVAVVLAFTLEPAAMLALNLLVNVPISLSTGSAMAALLTATGVGVWTSQWVRRRRSRRRSTAPRAA